MAFAIHGGLATCGAHAVTGGGVVVLLLSVHVCALYGPACADATTLNGDALTSLPEPDAPVVAGWNDSPVAGDRVDLHMGPIIAGNPEGARIEVTETGLRAFNATGTETASIAGEGGEFVGGEFRTSDALPGQVTLSDTANVGTPGLSVEPEDSTGYDVLPSIGPGPTDMWISGGVATDGTMSGANFNANGTSIYHNGPGENGAGAWSAVNSSGVEMRYRTDRTQVTPQTLIRAYADSAQVVADGGGGTFSVIGAGFGNAGVSTDRPDGRSAVRTTPVLAEIEYRTGASSRKLTVDATGVWVTTESEAYNLLETAQDSGWQPFAALPGITTSGNLAWRNKNGVIYMRGYVTGSWAKGYQFLTDQLPPEMRPTEIAACMAPSSQDSSMLLRVHPTGRIDLNKPVAGSATAYLSGISYPLG